MRRWHIPPDWSDLPTPGRQARQTLAGGTTFVLLITPLSTNILFRQLPQPLSHVCLLQVVTKTCDLCNSYLVVCTLVHL